MEARVLMRAGWCKRRTFRLKPEATLIRGFRLQAEVRP
jgi:hypothetical protein